MDTQTLQRIFDKFHNLDHGELASYIPELLKVNANAFAISVTLTNGETFSVGDVGSEFTLQSTSKPFSYALALLDQGHEYVHQRVGVEPTGEAFNSIIELEKKTHRPFNPMVNSGAIAIANMIKGKNAQEKEKRVLDFFSETAGRKLSVNESVFSSERKTAHRNRAIAYLLKNFDVINDEIEETLDLYFKACSLNVNVRDLSMMAATIANKGIMPISKKEIFGKNIATAMTGLIFSCGMYDTAGAWGYEVGIPAKSGVSGAIFGVVPGKMGIAVYSPKIDSHGHSARGVATLKELSKEFNLHIFS